MYEKPPRGPPYRVYHGIPWCLLAFIANDWADRRKEEKYVATILENLVEDVRNDSTNIIPAIESLRDQHDSLTILIEDLYMMKHKKANGNIGCAYSTYNVFDPTTETFESMVFGGDMKLVEDRGRLRSIKDLDYINNKLRDLHGKYYNSIESFRNRFICQYNTEYFDFATIPENEGTEFWNRLKFLHANVKYYYESLLIAQEKYNKFLADFRTEANG